MALKWDTLSPIVWNDVSLQSSSDPRGISRRMTKCPTAYSNGPWIHEVAGNHQANSKVDIVLYINRNHYIGFFSWVNLQGKIVRVKYNK